MVWINNRVGSKHNHVIINIKIQVLCDMASSFCFFFNKRRWGRPIVALPKHDHYSKKQLKNQYLKDDCSISSVILKIKLSHPKKKKKKAPLNTICILIFYTFLEIFLSFSLLTIYNYLRCCNSGPASVLCCCWFPFDFALCLIKISSHIKKK